jgi:peptidoglycan/xylan/chitin deacetylase (PgdA/CDA1 family)
MIKQLIKNTFSSPLGWRVLGPVLRPAGVIVLMYHRILGEDRSLYGLPIELFREQMRWLRDNCDPIAPEDFVARSQRPTRVRPAVLITFDDGYRDYHDLAYPVLKELGIPALVFLATQFMDEGGMIWTDEVQWACLSTKKSRVKLPWSGEQVPLDGDGRTQLSKKARAHLKTLPDTERRAALPPLFAELGDPPKKERQMLTWDEVRATQDITNYGGHSHTHPILSKLDRATAEREIATCAERITVESGRKPRYFAYPNGKPTDYTRETQEILRANGFEVAFATSEGIAGPGTDLMAVKRLPGEAPRVPDFVWMAAGLSRG